MLTRKPKLPFLPTAGFANSDWWAFKSQPLDIQVSFAHLSA